MVSRGLYLGTKCSGKSKNILTLRRVGVILGRDMFVAEEMFPEGMPQEGPGIASRAILLDLKLTTKVSSLFFCKRTSLGYSGVLFFFGGGLLPVVLMRW